MNGFGFNSLFNLIVRADPAFPMSADRMLEGTTEDVKQLVCRNGSYDLEMLSMFPSVMTAEFCEDDETSLAVIGYMDSPSLNPVISHPVMTVPSKRLLTCGLLGKWGNKRTHWKVVAGDPFRLLAPYSILPVGTMPAESDPRLVAMMMPFNEEADLDWVYQAIKEAAELQGCICKRVDELFTPTDITEDIHGLINQAGIVIADISGKNANVMYEYGYARGRGKDVIVITSDDLAGLPFDIRQRRVIAYTRSKAGLADLSAKIALALHSLSGAC